MECFYFPIGENMSSLPLSQELKLPAFGEIAGASTSIMEVAAFSWKNMDQLKWSSGDQDKQRPARVIVRKV